MLTLYGAFEKAGKIEVKRGIYSGGSKNAAVARCRKCMEAQGHRMSLYG